VSLEHAVIRRRAYTIAQFSEAFGPGKTKIYEEINAGRLRAQKCGRRTIITAENAEAWLASLPEYSTGEEDK